MTSWSSSKKSSAAVVGLGQTRFGKHPGLNELDLGQIALRQALLECNLECTDIDGLILSRIANYGELARRCGLTPRRIIATPGHGRFAGPCIQTAAWMISSGQAETVALVYATDSASRGETYGGSGGYGRAAGAYGGGDEYWAPYGMTSPGALHALMMQRYASLHGSSELDTAEIAITFRHHASMNPHACKRDPFTLHDYLNSRFICDPLRLYDYCMINDGGVAMVLTTAEKARELVQAPVYIKASAQASNFQSGDFPPEDFWYSSMQRVCTDLNDDCGLTPADMDGLMIYDNFTPTVLFTLEGFGYCPRGMAGKWVREGNLRLGHRYPTNTNGGHLSECYLQGWGLNLEAVRQLRNQCGARQIHGAAHIQYMAAAPIVSSVIYGAEP